MKVLLRLSRVAAHATYVYSFCGESAAIYAYALEDSPYMMCKTDLNSVRDLAYNDVL
jgi:hypothetical protein